MSADEELGLVFLPISSPSPNFWGGNRTEEAPYATSTTALDVETGKPVWSRQWVHHDLWDYDINSAPTLTDITVDGKEIPALIQATKMGFVPPVDRETPDCDYAARGIVSTWSRRNWAGERWPCRSISQHSL